MSVDFEYLKSLIRETIETGSSFKYFDINEDDCEITYISNKNKMGMVLQQGLMHQYDCKKYKLKEKSSIQILGTESGIFTLKPELTYTFNESLNWRTKEI